MKVVGIVPSAQLHEDENPYGDKYIFHDNYCTRVIDNGGVAVGIVARDGLIQEESLALCDSFVICGGRKIQPFHMQVAEYAYRNNKKLLGVCMGMQVIHSMFIVLEEMKKRNYSGSLLELYNQMKKERYMFVEPVEHHWDIMPTRSTIEDAKHHVSIIENTIISKYLQSSDIMGETLHHYRITKPAECVKIAGYADDGTIEAIEYGDKIIGVQFHPEIDDCLPGLFRFLTE